MTGQDLAHRPTVGAAVARHALPRQAATVLHQASPVALQQPAAVDRHQAALDLVWVENWADSLWPSEQLVDAFMGELALDGVTVATGRRDDIDRSEAARYLRWAANRDHTIDLTSLPLPYLLLKAAEVWDARRHHLGGITRISPETCLGQRGRAAHHGYHQREDELTAQTCSWLDVTVGPVPDGTRREGRA